LPASSREIGEHSQFTGRPKRTRFDCVRILQQNWLQEVAIKKRKLSERAITGRNPISDGYFIYLMSK
jgi:hypothetical protein